MRGAARRWHARLSRIRTAFWQVCTVSQDLRRGLSQQAAPPRGPPMQRQSFGPHGAQPHRAQRDPSTCAAGRALVCWHARQPCTNRAGGALGMARTKGVPAAWAAAASPAGPDDPTPCALPRSEALWAGRAPAARPRPGRRLPRRQALMTLHLEPCPGPGRAPAARPRPGWRRRCRARARTPPRPAAACAPAARAAARRSRTAARTPPRAPAPPPARWPRAGAAPPARAACLSLLVLNLLKVRGAGPGRHADTRSMLADLGSGRQHAEGSQHARATARWLRRGCADGGRGAQQRDSPWAGAAPGPQRSNAARTCRRAHSASGASQRARPPARTGCRALPGVGLGLGLGLRAWMRSAWPGKRTDSFMSAVSAYSRRCAAPGSPPASTPSSAATTSPSPASSGASPSSSGPPAATSSPNSPAPRARARSRAADGRARRRPRRRHPRHTASRRHAHPVLHNRAVDPVAARGSARRRRSGLAGPASARSRAVCSTLRRARERCAFDELGARRCSMKPDKRATCSGPARRAAARKCSMLRPGARAEHPGGGGGQQRRRRAAGRVAQRAEERARGVAVQLGRVGQADHQRAAHLLAHRAARLRQHLHGARARAREPYGVCLPKT